MPGRGRPSPRTSGGSASSRQSRLDGLVRVAADDVEAPAAEAGLENERRLELGRRQPRRDVNGSRMRHAGSVERGRRRELVVGLDERRAAVQHGDARAPRAGRAPRARARCRRASAGRRAGRARHLPGAGGPRARAGVMTVPRRVFVGVARCATTKKSLMCGDNWQSSAAPIGAAATPLPDRRDTVTPYHGTQPTVGLTGVALCLSEPDAGCLGDRRGARGSSLSAPPGLRIVRRRR